MEFTHVLFFLLVDAKSLICAIFERLLFSHFLKEKKNNLTSLRSSEKSHRFSDTKGLSKRDWGLEKLSFFFCSFRHFDEWELFPFGCIISHLQRATFVCSSMKFCRLYTYIRSKSSVPCSFWLTILGAKIWKNAILGIPQDS